MPRLSIAEYLSPWTLRRDKAEQQLEALRRRDGDDCRRCRRPMRFDLPPGNERSPKIEQILPLANGAAMAVDNLCLCHRRCNAVGVDHTIEVTERAQARAG